MAVYSTVVQDQVDLGDVLHDLRQPLVAIRALSSVPLSWTGEPERSEELRERLRRIGELGDWMNDLLGSSVVPEPPDAAPASTDAVQVVQDVLLAAAASFEGSLRWRRSGVAPVPVQPLQLRRALGNVVDNATRAAGPAGWVRVRVRRARHRVCVEVEDSGPGFGRMPAQSCRGLTVTRAVVDSCGGVVEIGSGRSGGALVRLRLPLSVAEIPARA